jgi:DNA-binding transcriptional regulator YiaG
MTPAEFRETRRKLGLSIAELGTILNTEPRTIRRWEGEEGARPPNPVAVRVLEWLLKGWRPPEWPTTTSSG